MATTTIPLAGKTANLFRETGNMTAIGLESTRKIFSRPWPVAEFLDQLWFLAKVTTLPVILISIPFGMVISLQVGALIEQLGAEAHLGSALVLAVVREQAPIATALIIAGAGGSAMCADLGRPADPGRDLGHGGHGGQPHPAPGDAPHPGRHRPGPPARRRHLGGGHRGRLVLRGQGPGRLLEQLLRQLRRALPALGPLDGAHQGGRASGSWPAPSPVTRASSPRAGPRAWATR